MLVGKSLPRVDAKDKVTGRTKYTEDLCDSRALVAKIVHSTTGHALVKSVDISEAEKVPGVVAVFTCFDVPEHTFPTAGHPWSMDPGHQDVADRHVLEKHVRYYGDDVAAVVAEDEVAAARAVRLVKVEYEELPVVLDAQEAMKDGAPQLHENYKNNILAHSQVRMGNYEEAIKEPGLIKVEGWYDTPTVQHCHIENAISYAYEENNKIVVVSSTQIPHIVRRCVGQALGIGWGKVRIIKPYIGGGFGDKQDALYEPLNAWLSVKLGGRLVKLDVSREETFVNCRVRHAIRSHIISYVRRDGTFAARKLECWSNQGAYASHGHGVCAKGMNAFPQLYPCENVECDSWTVFTNRSVAGAMRAYGMPQAIFAVEAHTEDVCQALKKAAEKENADGAVTSRMDSITPDIYDPIRFRRRNVMPVGYVDGFSKNELYHDSFNQSLDVALKWIDWDRKVQEYRNQTGPIRRGVGASVFWYNTAVWPISLESSSCRMVLNQDGSVQVQLGETEIGQGADTSYTQMTADTLGIPFDKVYVISNQDTDVTPYGTGAYASRQTYTAGMAIRMCAEEFKQKILKAAFDYTRMQPYLCDIVDGNIVRVTDGRVLMSLGELASTVLYSLDRSEHLTMEKTCQTKTNAYSFGCGLAEIEVNIPMCRVKILNLINVHDCGLLINPALAKAQVEGGMSMGIGYALSEKIIYDQKTGKALNNNLLDYKLSTTMDHPHLEARFVENPEPTSAYGTKSLGEPPVIPVAPSVRNALLMATGVAFNELPMDPHLMFREFSKAGLIND